MAPHVLQAVHVAHDGLGQVRQIPLAEVAQRQLAQALRQGKAGGLHLAVDQPVGGFVLLQVGDEGQRDEQQPQQNKYDGLRQRRAFCKRVHEPRHHQVEYTHAAHDHEVDDHRPEGSPLCVLHALIREGISALKAFAEHFTSPPRTWKCAT